MINFQPLLYHWDLYLGFLRVCPSNHVLLKISILLRARSLLCWMNKQQWIEPAQSAALLAEKSAPVGITPEEEFLKERLFEEVDGIWTQQKENESMQCVIRSFYILIMFLLKVSRTKFPDLRYASENTCKQYQSGSRIIWGEEDVWIRGREWSGWYHSVMRH